jgi:AraC-like DNA-binding protein
MFGWPFNMMSFEMQVRKRSPLVLQRPRFELLSAAERERRLAKRNAWLAEADFLAALNDLFDLVPDFYVFAKNQHSEIMFFSRSILENFGITDETSVIGLTDFDLTPAEMSQGYREQDAAVLTSGKPVLNRVELWFDRQGLPDWYVVNKLPVHSRSGEIVGLIGFLQPCQTRQQAVQLPSSISRAAKFIEEHYGEPIRIKEMARFVGISTRQMQRQFKEFFGISPHEYLVKTRVKAAAKLLRYSDQKLVQVALASGFCDQSALTRAFKEHVGITPRELRRPSRWRKSPA